MNTQPDLVFIDPNRLVSKLTDSNKDRRDISFELGDYKPRTWWRNPNI